MPCEAVLDARNSPVIFDTVRKWRSFCANTALDTRLYGAGTSDVRILVRSVLVSVRQRATSIPATCTSGGLKITMGHIGDAPTRGAKVHQGVRP
jgi:hypothetical protein